MSRWIFWPAETWSTNVIRNLSLPIYVIFFWPPFLFSFFLYTTDLWFLNIILGNLSSKIAVIILRLKFSLLNISIRKKAFQFTKFPGFESFGVSISHKAICGPIMARRIRYTNWWAWAQGASLQCVEWKIYLWIEWLTLRNKIQVMLWKIVVIDVGRETNVQKKCTKTERHKNWEKQNK